MRRGPRWGTTQISIRLCTSLRDHEAAAPTLFFSRTACCLPSLHSHHFLLSPNSHYPFSPVFWQKTPHSALSFHCQTHTGLSCPPIKAWRCYFSHFSFLCPAKLFFSHLQRVITGFLIAIIYPHQEAAHLCQASLPCPPAEPQAFGGVAWPSAGTGTVSLGTWVWYNAAKPCKKAQALCRGLNEQWEHLAPNAN